MSFVGFTLTILEKDWDFLYLSGLVLVTFFLATGWNLYKKKEFYESMLRDLSPHEEFVVADKALWLISNVSGLARYVHFLRCI